MLVPFSPVLNWSNDCITKNLSVSPCHVVGQPIMHKQTASCTHRWPDCPVPLLPYTCRWVMDGIAFSAAACTACPYFHNTCFLQRSLQTDKIRQANDLAIPQPAVDTRIEFHSVRSTFFSEITLTPQWYHDMWFPLNNARAPNSQISQIKIHNPWAWFCLCAL